MNLKDQEKVEQQAEDISKVTEKAILKVKSKETVIYIGPTVLGGVVANTAYCNGIPQELENMIVDFPAVKNLCVPISRLSTAKAELVNKNSALSILYQKVLVYKRGDIDEL